MTNADKIRSMTDEELADYLGSNSLCDQIQWDDIGWCENLGSCDGCIVNWLKQEVEE